MKVEYLILLLAVCLFSCVNKENTPAPKSETAWEDSKKTEALDSAFKNYWYKGTAEITSFALQQSRYGELHGGTSSLIYVTEQFLPQKQVKADRADDQNISILKLNSTKKFITGIYPYSIMNSSFHSLENGRKLLKNSLSIQEWCGHTYVQLNRRKQFEIQRNSYFENYDDQQYSVPKDHLENSIWTQIRIAPDRLPLGRLQMIPSTEYLALNKKPIKAFEAHTTLSTTDSLSVYEITYPALNRSINISFSSTFPYLIEHWEESYPSDPTKPEKILTTTADRMNTIRSDYWNFNAVADSSQRELLY